jgi:protein-tyrosine kinase
MGRVDDAIRRAAEAAAAGSAIEERDEAGATVITEDAETLSREPYPIEISERRRLRSLSPAPAATAIQAEPPQDGETAPEPTRPASLFSRIDSALAQKIVIDERIMPASREQYRRLAATLHQNQAATGLKVVMVSSALVSEGKTLTASNLALTFSESYQRTVLLIDGDLRRPSLHTVFNIDGSSGLSEGLMSVDEKPLALHQVSQRLTVLPAGMPISDPMAGLTSDRMRRVIDEARDAFDWVIIDTPPVGVLTDANLLGSMVDGAVLVIKADVTPYNLVQRAVDAIGRSRVLGVVLNRATTLLEGSKYTHYNYYYGAPKQLPPPK